MLTRTEKLLNHIDPANQLGVEIGALVSPIVTRSVGAIRYIDHATTEDLRLKYAPDPHVDVSKIVDVDYVWGEKSLGELTRSEAPFDYVLASHVIEHVPDLVGWLSEIRSILKPGGILSLAIPDKRQCFDYQRETTRLFDVIGAYLNQSRRPTAGQIFDHVSGAVTTAQGEWIWSGMLPETTEFKTINSLLTAWDITQKAVASDQYFDTHCWVLTPAVFLGLLADLAELGLLKFELAQFYETDGCEFFVSLRAVDQAIGRSAIQIPSEASPQLHPADVQLFQSLKERYGQETRHLETCIQAMESSKFWKLRTAWFKVKRKLGLSNY
jgi:Methyltransferase domain